MQLFFRGAFAAEKQLTTCGAPAYGVSVKTNADRPESKSAAAYHRWRRARLSLGLPTHHPWKLSRIERAYFRAKKKAAKTKPAG
ncbi:MAG: hypothetical protein QME74_01540 [Candidatus Edwardsbacteria bacterium]|nr:hypothetical protein [Candidatus Edwardsbacteria bacterium]